MIVGSLFVCEAQPAERLRNIVNTIRTNQMMNLFLQYKLGGGVGSGNVGRHVDRANDDGTVLVEELEGQNEEETPDEAKKSPSNNEIWQFFSIAMDRLVIVALLVIYVISIFTLIPLARLSITDPIKVEK
jgi:hypothetical protein